MTKVEARRTRATLSSKGANHGWQCRQGDRDERLGLEEQVCAQGLTKINAAVKQLITADKGRGLWTILVAVDDAAAMGKLKVKAVTDATNPKQNKTTIDGVFKAIMPDYLMILGVLTSSPTKTSSTPPASTATHCPGDLPYACDAHTARRSATLPARRGSWDGYRT